MTNKHTLKSVERYGAEGYAKQLASQRTERYKAKRNIRVVKARVIKRIEALEVEVRKLRNLKAIQDSFVHINAVKKVENTLTDLKKLF